jgi:hypothetical protein
VLNGDDVTQLRGPMSCRVPDELKATSPKTHRPLVSTLVGIATLGKPCEPQPTLSVFGRFQRESFPDQRRTGYVFPTDLGLKTSVDLCRGGMDGMAFVPVVSQRTGCLPYPGMQVLGGQAGAG